MWEVVAMQGVPVATQQRILAACKRNSEDGMTYKERNAELIERFAQKKAVDEKIAHNIPIIQMAEADSTTDQEQLETCKKALSCQKAEALELSCGRIGKQLNMNEGAVRFQYDRYLAGKL